jgi:hypothetical protein
MNITTRHADFSGTYVYALTKERVTVSPADSDFRWIITFPTGTKQRVSGTDMSLMISSRLLEKEPTS